MKFVPLYLSLLNLLSACVHETASFTSPYTEPLSSDDERNNKGDIRDETDHVENVNHSQHSRHLLSPGTECVLYLKAVQYEDRRQEDSWSCEFSPTTVKEFGSVGMIDIEGVSKDELDANGAISGETIIRVGASAYVDLPRRDQNGQVSLHIPSASNYAIEKMDEKIDIRHARNRRFRRRHRRKLKSDIDYSDYLEIYKVLVVRVIDASGKGPEAEAAELKDEIFNDNFSLKSQYEACSHNQILIEPASEFSTTQTIGNNNVTVNGVVEVTVDVLAETGKTKLLEYRALEAAQGAHGTRTPLAEAFDLVMFCQPPGTGDWLAYAYVNDYRSFYNNKWCQRVSAQMHEVGHNMNLAHSGLPNDSEYADKSGMMGFSYNVDNGPIQCFNPAKSFQLGWYEKQTLSINPLDFMGESRTFTLNGVTDYEKDGSNGDALVSLRLEHDGLDRGIDYYIGYNRRKGCNSGTEQVPNLVTLTEKENPNASFNDPNFQGRDGYGLSRRIAALNAEQSHTFVDYAGTTSDVVLIVNYIRGKDASITITTTEPKPTEPPTTCIGSKLQIELFTDNYGSETRWSIRDDETTEIIVQSSKEYAGNTQYILPSPTTSYCVTPGTCYTFTITDREGDGLCCRFGMGYYKAFLDGTEIFRGGNFDNRDVVQFCIPSGDDDGFTVQTNRPFRLSTSPPTKFPTDIRTKQPTLYPTQTASDVKPFSTTTSPTETPTKEPSTFASAQPTMVPSNMTNVISPENPSTQPSPLPSLLPSLLSLFPSLSPSILPSHKPSTSPSRRPTPTPTHDPGDQSPDCEDDLSFRYKEKKKRNCRWVNKGTKARTKGLCKKYSNGIQISHICKKTCGKVELGPCPIKKKEPTANSIFLHE